MTFLCSIDADVMLPENDQISEFNFQVDTTDPDTIYLTFGNWLYLCYKESSIPEDSGMQQETDVSATDSQEYPVQKLNGSIRVPDGYYVFAEGLDYTSQMCEAINVSTANMERALHLLQGQTLIVPAGEPYADSVHFFLKVKEKAYDDITLSELSMSEYNMIASAIVGSFGVHDYDTVEGNGLRFFVFSYNQGLGDILRYATIINGHMIYVYAQIGENTLSEQQRSDLEYIALSIRHAL